MAKMNSLFKYDGTFQGTTVVRSRAYGHHIRKARKKGPVNKSLQKSGEILVRSNRYAKAIQDAIDPYRRDFRDGQLWNRLVSIFKNQLQEGSVDFTALQGDELYKIHPLGRLFSTEVTTSLSPERTISVNAISRCKLDTTKGRADGHVQTLIVLFLDDDLVTTTLSETVTLPLSKEAVAVEQSATWSIPDKANTAIIVMKVDFSTRGKGLSLRMGMGMKVVKVVQGLKFKV